MNATPRARSSQSVRRPKAPPQQSRFKAPWDADTTGRTNFETRASPRTGDVACNQQWMGPGVSTAACDPAGLRNYSNADAPPTFSVRGPGVAGARPGIAQLLGAPLRIGQTIKVTGTAGPATSLVARLTAADGERVLRVGGLGLRRPGTATITVTGHIGHPTVRVRTGTGRTRTLKTPKATLVKPRLRARQRGTRLTVIAQATPRARVHLELRRGRHVVRRLTRTASPRGALVVQFRLARVTTVRGRVVKRGRSSATALAWPTAIR